MTKNAALYEFFSSFGIPAYPHTAVPDDAKMPYITYDTLIAAFGDAPVSLTVNVWYYTESEALPNAMVDRIAKAITNGGVQIPCDGGTMWITKGSPFAQSVADDSDKNIKRRYLNIDVEFNTTD